MNHNFHQDLQKLTDDLVDRVYFITKKFPKEEMFGVTSQLRRASLSVALNYVEGYARQRKMVLRNFLEIAYGSLKETRYLVYFSYKQGFIEKNDFDFLVETIDRIGRMFWGIISKLK